MKYPIYKDFLSELEKCKESIKHGTFTASGEIIRTATIGNCQVEIKLRAERSEILVDGGNLRRCEMRSLYSANKAEFNELLEKLKEATASVRSAIASILETLTSDQVPALVLERLKGNKIATDPAEATKDIASHQADTLADKLNSASSKMQLRIEAQSHGKEVLIVAGGGQGMFKWAEIQGTSEERGRFNNASIEDNLLFLKIFPELEEYVNGIINHLQEIQRLGWQMAQR